MNRFDYRKYPSFRFAPELKDRTWPDTLMTSAPTWCSVDLRDGNQALIDPMTIAKKMRFWDMLLKCGFKEVEIGFPSAAQVEFDFTRKLIEENRIPDDVIVQVLTQAREHLIARTYESLEGIKQAIVHVYNSTSKVQRDKAYKMSRAEIMDIAVKGAESVRRHAEDFPDTDWTFQYSPESFSQTEPDYTIEICEAVCRVWEPESGQRVILNLPATVESATPNLFADQIEYFCRHLDSRKHVEISLHTHNDRGCAVAAAELGRMAGADRIEGTLMGNGERTGNMDIVTMAMNLYSQGVDPELDFSHMPEIVQCVTECNELPVHPRHPYAGELVFTAFSGSHQDAIKKCLEAPEDGIWDIAYLPIDPNDVGRTYQDVVRINSQSGKGGVAYVLQNNYGVELPRWVQIRFSQQVQNLAEKQERELTAEEIWELFQQVYMSSLTPMELVRFSLTKEEQGDTVTADILQDDQESSISGQAYGTLSAFIRALENHTGRKLRVLNYAEHALSAGTRADAIAYVELDVDGTNEIGVATSSDTVTSMLKATLVALNEAVTSANLAEVA
ncbi:MAG: 2-isopropylmalate synthase [Pseudomonadota bacterium]